jgi:hypothetical protein
MAKFAFGFRDVRTSDSGELASASNATKDVVREITNTLYHVHDDTTSPTAADVKAVLLAVFPNMTEAQADSIKTAIAVGGANATARASDATGAISFRLGKSWYQYGLGYHASSEVSAINGINWKDLA